MIDDVLGEIRDVEVQAENIRKQAQQQARNMISQARVKAEQESKERYKLARAAARKLIADAEARASLEFGDHGADAGEAAEIRRKAGANIDEAVNFVIERIIKTDGDR